MKSLLQKINAALMIGAAVFLGTSAVYAEDTAEPVNYFTGSGKYFKLNPVTDGIIIGTGIGFNAADLILNHAVDFKNTEYDGKVYNKDDVNAFDRWAMQPYSKPLDITGSIVLCAAIASPAIMFTAPKSDWFTIGAMYAETMLLSYGLKEFGKALVTRARPYMYFDDPPKDDVDKGDWCCSFPSGHTTMAFSGAAFASYVFCKYNPDSPWKIPVIAGAYSLAAGTAILRMCSGNHFLTDVIAGAAIGTLSGILVPYLHTLTVSNNSRNSTTEIAVLPNGISFRIALN